MLCPNMLQLSLWLGLSYCFLALPGSMGATLSLFNSSLNATSYNGLDRPLTMCVNNTVHPTWGQTLEEFDLDTCERAFDLFAEKVKGRLYTSYDFYSRQVYPYGPAEIIAWPLVQGASTGWSKAAPARPSNDRR